MNSNQPEKRALEEQEATPLIEQMIFTNPDFDALNNMQRWNGKPFGTPMTVAAHSHVVSMFTAYFVERLYGDSSHILKYEASVYAIFHDFDEVFTGDILHPFKHSSQSKSAGLGKLLNEYCNSKIDELFDRNNTPLINRVIKGKNVHPATKLIVKLADICAMAQYCNKQLKMGNKYFEGDLKYTMGLLEKQAQKLYTYTHNEDSVNLRTLVLIEIDNMCDNMPF